MLYRNIFKVPFSVQNNFFGFCLLWLLLFRTGLDCEMDGTEKGGARERNPVGGEFDPICQRNLSSAATSAIGPKRENEEVDANRQEIDCKMDGTEKGGERNTIWVSLFPFSSKF